MRTIIIAVLTIILAPLIGGLLTGCDRKVSARFQGRYGPPVIQPFLDFVKLWSKAPQLVNRMQLVWLCCHVLFVVASLVMLVLGQDLLMILFVLAFGALALVLGAMSVRSPYSQIGAQRELLQVLAYEPILVLMVVGIYLVTGSFMITSIFNQAQPLLVSLPMFFIAFLMVLTIKLRKSPFDFSTSHHAHQELVKGMLVEYSGQYLALIELCHWYELVFVLALTSLFWATNLWIGAALALACYLLEILIDNVSARVTWQKMLALTWSAGLALCMVNLAWLYMKL
ncbi:MAG: respiratory chain complex I subunit 1 family protein [Bacillota bacterium]